MDLELISRRTIRRGFDSSKKEIPAERLKRQRPLSRDLFNKFAPKDYPSIFLDQRLGSRLSK
jgi:hypothetical protein